MANITQRYSMGIRIAFLALATVVLLAITRAEAAEPPFKIVPGDIPNRGILFANHEKIGRSGHGGACLTECANGDIIAFYSNVDGEALGGHGTGGWSEYKRSTDGGKTWSEPIVVEYTKKLWEGDEVFSGIVFCATTAPNGTIIATVVRFANERWVKQLKPVYLLSRDHGHTWSEPYEFDKEATIEDISMTFNASFVLNGEIFIMFMGGALDYCPGLYTLYVSTDNGQSFTKRSTLPFDARNYYGTASVLDGGKIIAYSYPFRGRDTEEHDIPYATSTDGGRTWSEVKTTHFAKAIRNPQMSGKIGDYYFIHGRSGSYSKNAGNLVLYSSKDGIHWDEGVLLMSRAKVRGGGDCYSANEVIGKYDPKTPNRLLIQSDVSYSGAKVNICHWWIEDIAGAEVGNE